MIVCTANITRSPYFAALLREHFKGYAGRNAKAVQFTSAGVQATTGNLAHPVIQMIASNHGISLMEHRSSRFEKVVDPASVSLILTMEERHKKAILEQFPVLEGRVFTVLEYGREDEELETLDVDDPTGKEVEDFQRFDQQAAEEAERVFQILIMREVI